MKRNKLTLKNLKRLNKKYIISRTAYNKKDAQQILWINNYFGYKYPTAIIYSYMLKNILEKIIELEKKYEKI